MIPDKLVKAYRNGNFGVFVGAGLSQGAGLPGWDSLLSELIDLAVKQAGISGKKEGELKQLTTENKYLLVAEELREILHNDLQKYIKERFDDKHASPTGTQKKVIQLKSRFIVTTNYDTLLENAYIQVNGRMPNPLTYKDATQINYNYLTNETFILKAHGDARSAPSEIILTEKDYRNVIYLQKGYQSILQVLFSTCHVLFLGASLKDPELNLMLGYIHNIFNGGGPDHFALINKDEITDTEVERWRKDFSINIITYDPHDSHKEVEDFLDNMLAL